MLVEGKIAIVTGGANGIGRGMVEALASNGAQVVIADMNVEAATQTAQEVGRESVAIETDVTDPASVRSLVDETVRRFGRLDVMCNNAGIAGAVPFLDINMAAWQRMLQVNLTGVFLGCQEALRQMSEQRSGVVINTASHVGKVGAALLAHYCATKFGVIGMTQSLAQEFGPLGIRVNAVCPGSVRTKGMWGPFLNELSELWGRDQEDIFNEFVERVPLKRPQQPEDIGNMVVFLASDMAREVSGQSFNVNGGQIMF